LLVMDYQVGIIGRLSDPAPLLDRMADAIATARSRGLQVGYVRVAFSDEDFHNIPGTNKSFSALGRNPALHSDSPETQIHEALAPQPGDIVVRKVRVGAFSTTDLDRQLQEKGIDTLILAGISTSGCVLSTVRDAADRDYRLYVLEDASADPDNEVHEILMKKVFPRQAQVISVAEFAQLLPAA
jgi:nicotinamidase-related amidase